MPQPVYSNHAGTLSNSYGIGKKGIKLIQGTANPTGLSAPVGSLYICNDLTSNRVYQIDGSGNWVTLLAPDDIKADGGLVATTANGAVTISAPVTKFKQQFTANAISGGNLEVTHNLNEDFPIVQIYDNNKVMVVPDSVTSDSANSVVLGLSTFGSFTGTWTVTIIAN